MLCSTRTLTGPCCASSSTLGPRIPAGTHVSGTLACRPQARQCVLSEGPSRHTIVKRRHRSLLPAPSSAAGLQTLVDWSGFNSTTVELRTANSEEDLSKVIAEAHLRQFPLKIVGSLHSANTIWFAGKKEDPPAACVAVDISPIKHVNIDASSTSAWVGAGIKLEDLVPQLEAECLCIDALGGVAHQSIAGIISTGTLPASPVLNMSFVTALRVLKWDEIKQEVVKETVDCTSSDYMLSLGMLYVVVEAQVQLVKTQPFGYDAVERIVSYSDAWEQYEQWNREYTFWRINWVTGYNQGLFWGAKPATAKADAKGYDDRVTKVLRWALAQLHKGSGSVYPLTAVLPDGTREALLKALASAGWGLILAVFKLQERLHCLHYHGSFLEIVPRDQHVDLRVIMAEWFFPARQVQLVADVLMEHYKKSGTLGCVPLELEPVKSNKVLLSPACALQPGEEIIYKVNFMFESTHDKEDVHKRLQAIWDDLLAAGVCLRWHWGKLHFADRALAEKVYGAEVVQRFVRESMPALRNAYFYKHFG